MEFIYLFVFRALSGAQNGAGYAGRNRWCIAITFLLVLLCFYPIVMAIGYDTPPKLFWGVVSVLGSLASAIGVAGVADSFDDTYNIFPRDIHLWELLATAGVTLSMIVMGGNWLYIIAHLYPALLLHKGFINLGSNKGFWYHGTDDPTGAIFAIPLLGIKVPRMSLRTRQVLALISLLLALATYIWGWQFYVHQLDF